RAPGLGHHAAMAANGAGAVAAAMEEQEHAARVASRSNRPLPGHAAEVDLGERDVRGDGPDGADVVEALAPLRPPGGPWLGRQQCADSLDLMLSHWFQSKRQEKNSDFGSGTSFGSPEFEVRSGYAAGCGLWVTPSVP